MRLGAGVVLISIFLSSIQNFSLATDCDQALSRRALRSKARAVSDSLSNPKQVEMELTFSEGVMALTTTANGKLGPLLEILGHLPQEIAEEIGMASYATVAEIPWDSVSLETKKLFLIHLGRLPTVDWNQDRRIPGLTVKSRFVAARNGKLLGRQIQEGESFDLGKLMSLEPHVEWCTERDVREPSDIEFHLAVSGSVREAARAAWSFERIIGVSVEPIHMHLLFSRDRFAFISDPLIYHVARMELAARMDIAFQMHLVVSGNPIRTVPDESGGVFFGPTTQQQYETEFYRVYRQLFGREHPGVLRWEGGFDSAPRTKGFVGYAGPGFYRDPTLSGLEIRVLEPSMSDETLDGLDRLFLHAAQGGANPELIRLWLEYVYDLGGISPEERETDQDRFDNAQAVMGLLMPHGHPREIHISEAQVASLEEWRGHLAAIYQRLPAQADREELTLRQKPWFEELLESNQEVAFILHEWHLSPVTFTVTGVSRQDYQVFVRGHQIAAAEELARVAESGVDSRTLETEANRIVGKFLRESGLYRLYWERVFQKAGE